MQSPLSGKEMKRRSRGDTLTVRKESFHILYHYFYDEDNDEEFTDEELETLNLNQAFNKYREKYNLPFPDQIKHIREKYGLNQTKMAEVLGFGVNVYRQYENGEIPSLSNGRLIQAAEDLHEFRRLIVKSNVLSGTVFTNALQNIERLITANKDFTTNALPTYLMTGGAPAEANAATGYKMPCLKKLTEMIVYFASEVQPWKTKLNKLLFYADFLHYKKMAYSISGAEYYAITMGPVPNNFCSIFEYAAHNKHVEVTYHEFKGGSVGESFSVNRDRKFNPEIFDEDELSCLKEVAAKLGKISTTEIVDMSHEEIAWLDNIPQKSRISYDYAFGLKHI
jgi:transcriptional regulator with XRE-family HTH domain/uncharacterized phage-associated protein